jgi:hypothetical protein
VPLVANDGAIHFVSSRLQIPLKVKPYGATLL